MKPCQKDNRNTAEHWDKYWSDSPAAVVNGVSYPPAHEIYGNPCRDIINILQLFNVDSFVDIGCGRGVYFKYINANKKVGVDISQEAIANLPKGVSGIIADLSIGIPIEDNKFDIVFSGETLEHLKDPEYLVKELHRICKPNGIVIINTPFENMIPCETHLWYIYQEDLQKWFSIFSKHSVYRFCNGASWEHFVVIARK